MATSDTTNTNITDNGDYFWFSSDGNIKVYDGSGGSSGTIIHNGISTNDIYTSTDTASIPSIWSGNTVTMERKMMTVKCCKCNKVVGRFYSTMIPGDTYCNMCHKLERLKE